MNAITVRALETPIVQSLAKQVELRDWGLVKRLLMASILFHHSNVRLPIRVERALSWLIMTPRLHGIHHASDPALRNTNWSSGLALWDILHGTRKVDVPQESIRIGIEGFTQLDRMRLGRMLLLPATTAGQATLVAPETIAVAEQTRQT